MAGATGVRWDRLVEEVHACRRCTLGGIREHPAIYRGGVDPFVVLVGEAPGAEEDRVGLPFVGRSGQRLDAALLQAGLGAEEFGILNLIKCRPPGNKFRPGSAAACRPFLDRQLRLLRPRLIVPLGSHALRAFDPDAPGITECAGRPRTIGDRKLFPLLHPAAPLHNPTLRSRWEADLAGLGAAVAAARAEI